MNIKRADLARYLLLIQFGGLYLDMDFQIDRPLGMLLTRGNVSFPLELISYLSGQYEPYYRASGNFKFIGNAFMAAIPNAGNEVVVEWRICISIDLLLISLSLFLSFSRAFKNLFFIS